MAGERSSEEAAIVRKVRRVTDKAHARAARHCGLLSFDWGRGAEQWPASKMNKTKYFRIRQYDSKYIPLEDCMKTT